MRRRDKYEEQDAQKRFAALKAREVLKIDKKTRVKPIYKDWPTLSGSGLCKGGGELEKIRFVHKLGKGFPHMTTDVSFGSEEREISQEGAPPFTTRRDQIAYDYGSRRGYEALNGLKLFEHNNQIALGEELPRGAKYLGRVHIPIEDTMGKRAFNGRESEKGVYRGQYDLTKRTSGWVKRSMKAGEYSFEDLADIHLQHDCGINDLKKSNKWRFNEKLRDYRVTKRAYDQLMKRYSLEDLSQLVQLWKLAETEMGKKDIWHGDLVGSNVRFSKDKEGLVLHIIDWGRADLHKIGNQLPADVWKSGNISHIIKDLDKLAAKDKNTQDWLKDNLSPELREWAKKQAKTKK